MNFGKKKRLSILAFALLPCFAVPSLSWADDAADGGSFKPEFWNVHFQATFLPQWHPAFPAEYSGPFSLKDSQEFPASFTSTLYLGFTPWQGGFLYANPEVPAGNGFSGVSGLGDFSNGEISKVGSANPTYNQARLYFQQVFGLGGEQEKIDDDQNQLAAKLDISRFTVTVGKFALNDFFDNNAYAHDARTQFINLTFIDNLAWDFAADTHGYTLGVVGELNQKGWAVRVAEAMVSTVANGPDYDGNLSRAHSDNAEFEWRYGSGDGAGKIRFLAYINQAHMGSYQDALNLSPVDPKVTATREYRDKYGFGLGWEQALGANWGLFARAGWNDGQTESWEFVAVDQNASLGAVLNGTLWGRTDDQVGLGIAMSGLSSVHQAYLAAGGLDFNIGDGALRYAPEEVAELYYLFKPIPSVGLTLDFQGIRNPGYNRDRGPVGIVSGRVHFEI
ncbi:MAG TPA: carbohydrate porin [bacterium]|nr:carbohydrate porin [bacterium]